MRAPATALPTPIPAAAPGAIDFECLGAGVVVLDDFVVLSEFVVLTMATEDETPRDAYMEEEVVILDEFEVGLKVSKMGETGGGLADVVVVELVFGNDGI